MTPDKNYAVTTNMTNTPELLPLLDEMVAEDMTDRSKFIKKLIRDEHARRKEARKAEMRERRNDRQSA